MKTIAFYISEYGYGHATRSIAIIHELLKTSQDIRMIICHSFALSFIQESLKQYNDRVLYHEVVTDIGYVLQKHSLGLDAVLLGEKCRKYLSTLSDQVETEVTYLNRLHVDLILSDISPIAFEIAEKLNVLSVGISNFTWYTAYENVLSEDLMEELFKLYSKMDYFFSLAGSQEPTWGKEGNPTFGFYSRQPDLSEVQRIQLMLNPNGDKNLIFVPIGMKIDLGDITSLSLWDQQDYTFIVSSNMDIYHPNVYRISEEYTEVQNYVVAADLVISKAGWGTISEAVNNGTPLLIINRQGINEDQNTIHYLKENELCNIVTWEELNAVKISEYIIKPTRKGLRNEARQIVSEILGILELKLVLER